MSALGQIGGVDGGMSKAMNTNKMVNNSKHEYVNLRRGEVKQKSIKN